MNRKCFLYTSFVSFLALYSNKVEFSNFNDEFNEFCTKRNYQLFFVHFSAQWILRVKKDKVVEFYTKIKIMKWYSIIMYLKNTLNNLFKKNFYRKDGGFAII